MSIDPSRASSAIVVRFTGEVFASTPKAMRRIAKRVCKHVTNPILRSFAAATRGF